MVNRDGTDERVIDEQGKYSFVTAVSQKGNIAGSTLANLSQNEPEHLFVLQSDDLEPPSIIASNNHFHPAWSTDGQYLLYDHAFRFHLMSIPDGKVRQLPITNFDFVDDTPIWSPNDQYIAFTLSTLHSNNYADKHIYLYHIQHEIIQPLISQK
jgi:Tol biopolymer transport system component